MSAWVNGVLKLNCSLESLRRAIANLHPEWAKYIKVDPSGKMRMYRYDPSGGHNGEMRTDKLVHLIIPGSGNPNAMNPPDRISDNDWAFAKRPDGTWECLFADFGKEKAKNLMENEVKAEILKLRSEAMAKLQGYTVIKKTKSGKKTVMELEIDEDQMSEIKAIMSPN